METKHLPKIPKIFLLYFTGKSIVRLETSRKIPGSRLYFPDTMAFDSQGLPPMEIRVSTPRAIRVLTDRISRSQ